MKGVNISLKTAYTSTHMKEFLLFYLVMTKFCGSHPKESCASQDAYDRKTAA